MLFYVTYSDTQIVLGVGMRANAEIGRWTVSGHLLLTGSYMWQDLFMSRKANYSGQSSKESKYAMPCISAATFTTHSPKASTYVYNRQWPAGYEKNTSKEFFNSVSKHIIGRQADGKNMAPRRPYLFYIIYLYCTKWNIENRNTATNPFII